MKEKEMFKWNGFVGLLIVLVLIVGLVLSARSFVQITTFRHGRSGF